MKVYTQQPSYCDPVRGSNLVQHVQTSRRHAVHAPHLLTLHKSPPARLAQVREKDWCNVITAHHGDSAAYTWRLQNFTLGEHVLKPPKSKKRKAEKHADIEEQAQAPVTAVAMSQCGNYGLVGRASGTVDRYNMQSGLHRGSYTR